MTTDVELVQLDKGRVAVTGVTLPSPPPTRVYISGRLYRLSPSPTIALPPLLNTVKVVANWVLAGGRLAKNIYYLKMPVSFVTSDPFSLIALANSILAAYPVGGFRPLIASTAQVQSVTCKDNAGTSAFGVSTGSPMIGTAATAAFPPQVAVCLSWDIAESYRGGKPRWYLPGIPTAAVNPVGTSTMDVAYATAMEAAGSAFAGAVNAIALSGGGNPKLGTVSYYSGHAVRPTPQFREFLNTRVHERLDSQRRRSGHESAFGVIP
jgi:hypothetical protein